MKRLSKEEVTQKDNLIEKLKQAQSAVEEAVDTLNDAIEERWSAVETSVSEYNEIVAEINEFAEEIYSQMESYFSDRSEKWQESEKGESYTAWMEPWESVQSEEVEIDQPDSVSYPDFDLVDLMEELPEEPDQ